MSLRELSPGQRHEFAAAPLSVELTGPGAATAMLAPVDQAGSEVRNKRSGAGSVHLTPRPQRLRLVVRPVGSATFPAGATVGLSLRSEGSTTSVIELVIPASDVSALEEKELAVLEFAPPRTILTVPRAAPQIAEDVRRGSVVGELLEPTIHAAPVPPTPQVAGEGDRGAQAAIAGASSAPLADDEQQSWLNPGRYAFREAVQLRGAGATAAPPSAWAIVLDGSASMRGLFDIGQLDTLVGLLSGVMVEWVQRWSALSSVSAARARELTVSPRQAHELTRAAFTTGDAPSSWSAIAEGVDLVLGRIGPAAGVVVITDGPPADLERLIQVLASFPDASVSLVVVATSVRYGLRADQVTEWWQEELGALAGLTAVGRVRVVAVKRAASGGLELGGTRAAELASRLISEPAEARA